MKLLSDLKYVLVCCFLFLPAYSYSGVGAGLGITQGAQGPNGEKKKEEVEPFIKELAPVAGVEESKLEEMRKTGYGRSEMISVALISKKSGKPIDDVIKDRNTFMSLRELSGKYGVPYDGVKQQASEIKKQIEDIIYSQSYQQKLSESASGQFLIHISSDTRRGENNEKK